ncbi:hypothetical protein [Maridesulfovibrio sp.]|uniref:hypothetical protein n=1 Tax=Maridesulfovibrio sp. TaxID=2795000 RepID=UPI003BAD2465
MRRIHIFFICLALAFIMAPGCALKKLSDLPAEDQAVEYANMLLGAYNATHHKYLEIKPSLTAEQREKAVPFVRSMNIARPAALLLAKNAEAWKTIAASQNATLTEKARLKYRDQKVLAAEIWSETLGLWNRIRRQE